MHVAPAVVLRLCGGHSDHGFTASACCGMREVGAAHGLTAGACCGLRGADAATEEAVMAAAGSGA